MMPSVIRVVVTGMGAVSSVGNSADELWRAVLEGRSGVAPITAFPAEGSRPSYAAEVKAFSPDRSGLPRKKLKMMGRHAQLAFAAVQQACADAGLDSNGSIANRSRFGVILGVGMLSADVSELGRAFDATARASTRDSFDAAAFGRAGTAQMFPLWLLRHIPNLVAAHAAIALDARGPSNTIATGCVAGAHALGEASRLIARGDADVLVAGGTDARVSPLGMMRYHDLGWLATRDDIEPATVSAPFDASATGFVNAEGAGILVLESLEHARTRGARILAELGGYGAANDAHDVLMPHPCGRALTRATSRSLEQSGLGVNDVDAVFAPAASVPAFDRAIASAWAPLFGGRAHRPPVTATRALLGHAHAASAVLDCIAAVKALQESLIPPMFNLRQPIADFEFAGAPARSRPVSAAVVGAYGFGGHAAALTWRRYSA